MYVGVLTDYLCICGAHTVYYVCMYVGVLTVCVYVVHTQYILCMYVGVLTDCLCICGAHTVYIMYVCRCTH